MVAANLDRGVWRLGVLVSFMLTLVACALVLAARISRGDLPHPALMSGGLTLAALVCVVAMINAANRLAVIVHQQGGSYEPGMFDSLLS